MVKLASSVYKDRNKTKFRTKKIRKTFFYKKKTLAQKYDEI